MENLYTIVALPESKTRKILNDLRQKLYADYLLEPRKPTSEVHITLAQLKTSDPEERALNEGVTKIAREFIPITLSDFKIKIDPKFSDDKIQIDYNWIGLNIKSPELRELSEEIRNFLQKLGLDDTPSYLERSGFQKEIPLHFTFCPKCIPQKSNKAKSIIEKVLPEKIIVDMVALRAKDGKLLL